MAGGGKASDETEVKQVATIAVTTPAAVVKFVCPILDDKREINTTFVVLRAGNAS